MSLRKERLSWIFIGILLAAVGLTAYFVLLPQLQPHLTLRLGDGVFNARFISPTEQANNGTQTIEKLPEGKAVLRMYKNVGKWPIDMKDRQEAFDLIWLDEDKRVIHIVKNASGESTPSTEFSPNADARYMIEMRGGTVDSKAIRIDQVAEFDEYNIQGLKL